MINEWLAWDLRKGDVIRQDTTLDYYRVLGELKPSQNGQAYAIQEMSRPGLSVVLIDVSNVVRWFTMIFSPMRISY